MKPNAWNELIAGLPEAHLLQTYEWGQVKARYGWQKGYQFIETLELPAETRLDKEDAVSSSGNDVEAAALILKKNVLRRGFPVRLCILYSPKGPLLRWEDPVLRKRVLDDLQSFARQQGAIFFKADRSGNGNIGFAPA